MSADTPLNLSNVENSSETHDVSNGTQTAHVSGNLPVEPVLQGAAVSVRSQGITYLSKLDLPLSSGDHL